MGMWNRMGVWVAAVGLLLISLAALDDITTGNEPSFTAEYMALTGSLVSLAALVRLGRR